MDKIKITINGHTFEAEGNDLTKIIDNFFNEISEDKEVKDFPDIYKNYEDYLGLIDINPSVCTTPEICEDCNKKLIQRLQWIDTHPNVDLTDVKTRLRKHLGVILPMSKGLKLMEAYCRTVLNDYNKNKSTNCNTTKNKHNNENKD